MLFILLTCFLVGGFGGYVFAQDGEDPPMPPISPNISVDEVQPGSCGLCHLDVTDQWRVTSHASAFIDPEFQTGWAEQEFDLSCLQCHAQGLNRSTSEVAARGVNCTSCHGDDLMGHPEQDISVEDANDTCQGCHTVTSVEFAESHHVDAGMDCLSCHYAHQDGLRGESEIAQCSECHAEQITGVATHESHLSYGMTCGDCHGYVDPTIPVPPTGLGPTGHDFEAGLRACVDCHEDQETVVEGDVTASVLDGPSAARRALQLEAALDTLLIQGRNQTALSVAQGSVGGLVVGVIAVWLLTTVFGRSANTTGTGDEE
ncbi:MAG: hypothetical protein GYB68_07495 [Chloroflexi bacterium]|nr:hypothetical protein [Chloroflexota bacterium]